MSEVEKVVVVGTGFVGLPLALLLASNDVTVVGVDVDKNLIEAINDASLNLDETELETLLEDEQVQENLVAQTSPEPGDAFVVSVPTPLTDPGRTPDLSHVEAAIESTIPHLSEGDVINIESTIPPKTCEGLVTELLREGGYEPGEDVHLAHSPERILPGNVFEEIVNNDRVIGGQTPECVDRATAIYEPFLEGSVYETDLLSAELCKLLENTFRDVNVALANEFALIGESLGVAAEDVIELANKHPRVDILSPGIGVGGHCLPVDPWFLNAVAPEQTELVTTAREVNDQIPRRAAQKIRRFVADRSDPDILVFGQSYKPGTYDARNSPAAAIIEELHLDGYAVTAYDTHVPGEGYESVDRLIEREQPDVVIQLVCHKKTVGEIDSLLSTLADRGISVGRFNGARLVDLTDHE